MTCHLPVFGFLFVSQYVDKIRHQQHNPECIFLPVSFFVSPVEGLHWDQLRWKLAHSNIHGSHQWILHHESSNQEDILYFCDDCPLLHPNHCDGNSIHVCCLETLGKCSSGRTKPSQHPSTTPGKEEGENNIIQQLCWARETTWQALREAWNMKNRDTGRKQEKDSRCHEIWHNIVCPDFC